MAKNTNGGRKPERTKDEQRRLRIQQIIFAAFALLLILSMLLSLIRF